MRNERKDLILGRMALFEGMISQSQIDECVDLQSRQSNPAPLGKLLVERGLLSEKQLQRLLDRQAEHFASTDSEEVPLIGRLAIQRGYCTPSQVHEALREQCRAEQAGSQVFLGQLLLKSRFIDATQFMKLLHLCEAPELDPLSSDDDAEQCLTPDMIKRGEIGKYQILHEISRGGMGVVYKARHRQLGKEVALKVLKKAKLSDSRIKRFKQEGRLVAQLSHRNIVQLYDWGHEEGIYYYTMAYIEGMPLDEYNDRKRLSENEAARIVATLAHAVHYAHEQGIIHRDLKPANILMDDQDEPHLTDFGLAKSLLKDLDLTRMGQALGTPSYMPPEQARGDKSGTDRRSDVYSLGAILYELLTDQPPFAGINPFDYYNIILEEAPEPLRALNPDVSEEMVAICNCAMAKRLEDRYATAEELAEDLEALVGGAPVRAGTLNQRIQQRRRPRIIGTLIAALAIGGGVLLGNKLKQRRRRLRVQSLIERTEQTIGAEQFSKLPRIFDSLGRYGVSEEEVNALERKAVDRLLRRAHQALRKAQVDRLEELLRDLAGLQPDHPERASLQASLAAALVAQARVATEKNQLVRARRLLTRAKEYRPPAEVWKAADEQLARLEHPEKFTKPKHPPKKEVGGVGDPRLVVPQVVTTKGRGAWTSGHGSLDGVGKHGVSLVLLGDKDWCDYVITCEVRLLKGQMGVFVRGLAKNCQFPGLFSLAGVKPDPEQWYRLDVAARGHQLIVTLEGGRPIRRTNTAFRHGLFGFAAHPSSQVQVRKLRVQVLKVRPK